MWLWPLGKPWVYSPLGYALAVIWNVCELLRVRVPFASWTFGVIIGCKGHKGGPQCK